MGEELGGIGDTYSNDDFNNAGTWVTPGSGGSAVRVAAVSPDKSGGGGGGGGCCVGGGGGGGYKVYFGFSPATPFVVSGSGLVWNAGIPFIIGSGSPALDWRAATLSKNGEFALAVAVGEKIRTAANFGSPGAQWGTLTNSPSLSWVDIAARRDLNTGSFGTIAAIENPGSIWMSFDNGVTWEAMPGTTGKAWTSITCKSDGSAFAATVSNGNIWTYPFTSTTTTTTTIGGPVPPRLWSRAQPDCIATIAPIPGTYNSCCDDNVGSWTDRGNSRIWNCVASDSTGNKLVAAVTAGTVYISNDCGITWTDSGGGVSTTWTSIACDATGDIIAGIEFGGQIRVSTNRGSVWALALTMTGNGVAITTNNSGTVIAAMSYDAGTTTGYLAISVDTGGSWATQTFAAYKFTSISSNGDGSQLILCTESGVPSGRVYIASSPGYVPIVVATLGSLDWSSVASNAAGDVLIAANTEPTGAQRIHVSSDSGVNWNFAGSPAATTRWSSVASNAAGDVLVAISDGQGIYSSSDFGATWTLFNPPLPGVVITNSLTQKCIASNSFGNKLVAVFNTTPDTPGDVWTYCSGSILLTPAVAGLTQEDLNMRRKAEILQYKKNNSNMSKKQLWARTIKGHGPNRNRTWATQSADGTYTNPNMDNLARSGFTLRCPGRPNNCAPTTNSDVPGKQMLLCMRPDIPLTNYIVNRTYLAGGTKWPQTAWKPGDNGFPVGKAGRNLVFR
jgi:hypothetical protein